MKLAFTKMHGAGNDFVVLDATRQPFALTRAQIQRLADRHFGVGCDQVLVVEPAARAGVDFRYRIFNADGGEVEQCGNGARCFVKFVRDKGLTSKREIRVETLGGIIVPRLEADGEVSVDMGAPRFARELPFIGVRRGVTTARRRRRRASRSVLSMGNPHAVQVVRDVERAPVAHAGPAASSAIARFPSRVNAGYMQVSTAHRIALRVWERGAGETLACGTGACAAVVAGIRRGLLDSPVRVATRGGDLTISWAGRRQSGVDEGPGRNGVRRGQSTLATTQ